MPVGPVPQDREHDPHPFKCISAYRCTLKLVGSELVAKSMLVEAVIASDLRVFGAGARPRARGLEAVGSL